MSETTGRNGAWCRWQVGQRPNYRLPSEGIPALCATMRQGLSDWERLERAHQVLSEKGVLRPAFLAWPAEHKQQSSGFLRSPFPCCAVQDLLRIAWMKAQEVPGGHSFYTDWGLQVVALIQATPEEIEAELVLWALAREEQG